MQSKNHDSDLLLLQEIIEIFPFYVMILDNQHRIVAMNKAGLAIKEIPLKDLVGRYCYQIYHNLDQPFLGCPLEPATIHQTIEENDFYDPSIQRWIRAKIYPLPPRFRLNQSELYLHFSEDITKMKRMEAEQLKTQSLEMVRLMSRGLSHDIMNILQILLSHATLGYISKEKNEIQEHLEQIITAIDHIKVMIHQLTRFSAEIILNKKPSALNDLINKVLKSNCFENHIQIATEFDKSLPLIDVDPYKITEVFQNLILNARQAIVEEGSITITTKILKINPESSIGLDLGYYVQISIKDSGCGIPPENLSKIFFPLFTTKKTGNGLGLAMCQLIIQAHNGLITVDSELGKGSTFHLYLPIGN